MIGTVLSNRYKLEEEIGVGGTAVVYKAKDILLNRNVAVKVLKSEFSDDDEFVSKFKREATSAASISDTNIVNIYDVGTEGKINYIVMEYIDGKTLKEVIKEQGKIGPKALVGVAIQISKALDCAHRNNIIHRDIKPHNIMVTKEGLVKVTDFGIAKASNSVTITSTNKVLGSAHYLSPEQAQGKQVDCRTDIYSFGIVLYEMATGKVPHDADTPVSVALKHIQEPVDPPRNLNGSIPNSLNNLILKCLEKNPASRYQSAKEVLSDLIKIKNNLNIDEFQDDSMDDEYTRVMEPVKIKDKKEPINKNIKNDDENDDDDDEDIDDLDDKSLKNKGSKISDKKKKILIGSIIAVILIAGSALAFAFGAGLLSNSPSTKKVAVPSIIGKTKSDATDALKKVNLKLEVVGTTKSDKPKGTVIACSPDEGTEVLENTTVRVNISSGPETKTLPSLKGMSLSDAKAEISNDGCTLGNVSHDNSDTVPSGCVISQDPPEGTDITSGMIINLVISNGPKQDTGVTVPDVSGKSYTDAQNILSSMNLVPTIKWENTTDQSKNGIVDTITPGAGNTVAKGSQVIIFVWRINAAASSNTNTQQTASSNTNSSGNGQSGGSNTSTSGSNGQSGNTTQPSGNNTASGNNTTGSNTTPPPSNTQTGGQNGKK